MSKIALKVKALGVVLRLVRICDGPLSYRLKVTKKYYNHYIYHTQQQNQKFKVNLTHLQRQKETISYKESLSLLYQNYVQKGKTQVTETKRKLEQKDKSSYQKQVSGFLYRGMQYLSLYYESLQSLIEGRRQVLQNEDFQFQDGESVEQKRIKFEKFFSKLIGRKQKQLQQINDLDHSIDERKSYSSEETKL